MHRIEGDGVTLSVLDEGAGPPVLLLHGFPDSSSVWRHQIPALLDRLGIEQADVVGYDWGAGVAWTLAAYVLNVSGGSPSFAWATQTCSASRRSSNARRPGISCSSCSRASPRSC